MTVHHKQPKHAAWLPVCAVLVLAVGILACGQTPAPTAPPTATSAPTPALTATPPPTDTPAPMLRPTSTLRPTEGAKPTVTPLPTDTPTPQSAPTTTPAAVATRAPAATATPRPAGSGVVATFLADARQTQRDLGTIKTWFDRLAGGESIPCSTIYAHSIHRPSSNAPSTVPDLAPTWNEYQAAIADGQTCLQWLVDFCDQGGGVIDEGTFWNRRELSSSALSHCEHVVQALEAMQ